MQATPLRAVLASYATLPADIETSGEFAVDVRLEGRGGDAGGQWLFSGTQLGFSNPDATVAGENIAFTLGGRLDWPTGGALRLLGTRLESNAGQALLGPALLDLQANPLQLQAEGRLDGDLLKFEQVQIEQRGLLRAAGSLHLRIEPQFGIAAGQLSVTQLQFPAAYTSFVQLAAAATVFGDLDTRGSAVLELQLENDAVSVADLALQGIDLTDRKGKFRMKNLRGEVRWRSAPGADTPVSWLSWDEGGSYGLGGGAARIDFFTAGRGFRLAAPARIPIFDGGLQIQLLAIEDIGLDAMRGTFEGEILPIGMPQLSKAFGWPSLAGTLGGSIPRVEYRDKLMRFSGDVVARVFDGRIVGSNLRLQDPLGPWPRFFADVRVEGLDLAMVTDTFEIGSITGRLEGDIRALELFNWSPVKFDASLRTPAGDRSPHRISAKAVGTLSDIGNSGGGGFARLQQGVLSFFDEYDYDRIGIRCQLDNETCTMSGIERAGIGYYILQGKGVPRINIIGNAGRVNWPALVDQVSRAMSNSGQDIKVDR
jgi:hypothetical protein